MKGTPAIYLGRIVDKAHFRTKVYGPKGEKKLVESWAEYENAMQSGIWFATLEDAMESVALDEVEESEGDATPKPKPNEKPRNRPNGKASRKAPFKPKPKPIKVEEVDEDEGEIPHDELDEMVFEVKDGK